MKKFYKYVSDYKEAQKLLKNILSELKSIKLIEDTSIKFTNTDSFSYIEEIQYTSFHGANTEYGNAGPFVALYYCQLGKDNFFTVLMDRIDDSKHRIEEAYSLIEYLNKRDFIDRYSVLPGVSHRLYTTIPYLDDDIDLGNVFEKKQKVVKV